MSDEKVKAVMRDPKDPDRELHKVTLIVSLPAGTSVEKAWDVVALGAVVAAEGPVEVVYGYGAAVRLLSDPKRGAFRARCTGFSNKAIPKGGAKLLMYCHNEKASPKGSVER